VIDPAPRGDVGKFAAELSAIDRARAALAAGDATTALAELERGSASSAFLEERSALRIVALCSTERGHTEGRRELARFEAAFPRSLQLARARGACAAR
jgi:hypothetical protein